MHGKTSRFYKILMCAARRARTERAAEAMSSNGDDVVVPMESLGIAYRRLAGHNRLGKAITTGARSGSFNVRNTSGGICVSGQYLE